MTFFFFLLVHHETFLDTVPWYFFTWEKVLLHKIQWHVIISEEALIQSASFPPLPSTTLFGGQRAGKEMYVYRITVVRSFFSGAWLLYFHPFFDDRSQEGEEKKKNVKPKMEQVYILNAYNISMFFRACGGEQLGKISFIYGNVHVWFANRT